MAGVFVVPNPSRQNFLLCLLFHAPYLLPCLHILSASFLFCFQMNTNFHSFFTSLHHWSSKLASVYRCSHKDLQPVISWRALVQATFICSCFSETPTTLILIFHQAYRFASIWYPKDSKSLRLSTHIHKFILLFNIMNMQSTNSQEIFTLSLCTFGSHLGLHLYSCGVHWHHICLHVHVQTFLPFDWFIHIRPEEDFHPLKSKNGHLNVVICRF